ncbi:MAG TPA: hypothetical protein DCZ92_08495 [Elusimicrobia bacterium]|nr:hypothetical protein [Elusimicrobiota bacterium]
MAVMNTTKPAPDRPTRAHFAVLVVFEVLLVLAAAEIFIAWTKPDQLLLGKLIRYQGGDSEVHRLSEDIALHYELNPGASAVYPGNRKAAVNSLGFRDRPRTAAKPAGVTRIICLGSSNTYGASVSNGQDWPARLERALNARAPGKYEVWNAGVNAYVVPQTVAAARRFLRDYAPDLLLFQLNNCGRRLFLVDRPFKRYFDEDPGLYLENLRYGWPRSLNFLRHWGLLRCVALYANCVSAAKDYQAYEWDRNVALTAASLGAFREFYEENKGKVPMALLFPTLADDSGGVDAALAPLGLPAIRLAEKLPARHSPDFDELHPPAYVYDWYAGQIMKELHRFGLLPAPGRGK